MQTFFDPEDYEYYLELLSLFCKKYEVEVLSYCLMPNHIHLIVLPSKPDSLKFAISATHERYTKFINYKKSWKGHLWQGRFFSVPLDEKHFQHCIPYVELNPVRAGLVREAYEYKWSSAYQTRKVFSDTAEESFDAIRKNSTTGRPLGNKFFLNKLESLTRVKLVPQKPGPKKRETN